MSGCAETTKPAGLRPLVAVYTAPTPLDRPLRSVLSVCALSLSFRRQASVCRRDDGRCDTEVSRRPAVYLGCGQPPHHLTKGGRLDPALCRGPRALRAPRVDDCCRALQQQLFVYKHKKSSCSSSSCMHLLLLLYVYIAPSSWLLRDCLHDWAASSFLNAFR